MIKREIILIILFYIIVVLSMFLKLSFLYSFIIITFFMIILVYQFSSYEKKMMYDNLENFSLRDKTMYLLIENISHELNSPIFVMKDKIEELKNFILESSNIKIKEEDIKKINCPFLKQKKCLNDNKSILIENVNLITENIKIIDNISKKFSDYQDTKLSNGNKTIFDIIKTSKNIISIIIKKDIIIKIDENLKNFRLSKMKNEDLMNIFINLFKNSFEANAIKCEVKIDESTIDKLKIIIFDDGKGIVDKNKGDIFKLNFSSKGELRGFGLSYAKKLLNDAYGDIELVWSEKGKGTIFKITVLTYSK